MTTDRIENNDQEWRDLWTLTDEGGLDLDRLQEGFEKRHHGRRWRERREYLAILGGVGLTLYFLITLPLSVSLVVLVLFCWTVWGVGIRSRLAATRSAQKVRTRPPSEFVQNLREYSERRRDLMQMGKYLLVAVGVFAAVWTSWMIGDHWDAYVQEPWRAVVGVGGVVVLYLLAVVLHRREVSRLDEEIAELGEIEQRL